MTVLARSSSAHISRAFLEIRPSSLSLSLSQSGSSLRLMNLMFSASLLRASARNERDGEIVREERRERRGERGEAMRPMPLTYVCNFDSSPPLRFFMSTSAAVLVLQLMRPHVIAPTGLLDF